MNTHQFTLIVDGPDLQDPAPIDALFAAGCGDALIGVADGVQYLDFDREAPSLERAILSAIADIEDLEGVTVVRLADAGLVSMSDIAERLGRTRESVRLLVAGERGPGGFPAPVTDPRGRYRLWRSSEVDAWLTAHVGLDSADSADHIASAINAVLKLRSHSKFVDADEHAELRKLSRL